MRNRRVTDRPRKWTVNLLILVALLLFSLFYWCSAGAAGYRVYLESEQDLGNGFKHCIYSEGIVITVPSHKLCPLSVEV